MFGRIHLLCIFNLSAECFLLLTHSKEKNEGVGVKLLHVLNDGLWKVQALD